MFRRSLGLLMGTNADMKVLVGESNCPSVEALRDALTLENGKFQIVSAAVRSAGCRHTQDYIVVMQPGWDAHQLTERAGFSAKASIQPFLQQPAACPAKQSARRSQPAGVTAASQINPLLLTKLQRQPPLSRPGGRTLTWVRATSWQRAYSRHGPPPAPPQPSMKLNWSQPI